MWYSRSFLLLDISNHESSNRDIGVRPFRVNRRLELSKLINGPNHEICYVSNH